MGFLDSLNLVGMIGNGDLNWVGGVITLLIGGAILPAVITLLVNALRLPILKQTVGKSCFIAGKAISALATKRLGKLGKTLEDGLQDLKNYANEQFDKGLDADDK